jgi:hypothetical protein
MAWRVAPPRVNETFVRLVDLQVPGAIISARHARTQTPRHYKWRM